MIAFIYVTNFGVRCSRARGLVQTKATACGLSTLGPNTAAPGLLAPSVWPPRRGGNAATPVCVPCPVPRGLWDYCAAVGGMHEGLPSKGHTTTSSLLEPRMEDLPAPDLTPSVWRGFERCIVMCPAYAWGARRNVCTSEPVSSEVMSRSFVCDGRYVGPVRARVNPGVEYLKKFPKV